MKYLILFISMLFLFGCQTSHQLKVIEPSKLIIDRYFYKDPGERSFFSRDDILALELDSSSYYSILEWKDEENILYLKEAEGRYELLTHNVFTGINELFYSSEDQIISITANGAYDLFAIHTAPTSFNANIIIVNKYGLPIIQHNFPSFDIAYEWNPYNSDQLMITSFQEDWTFESYALDTKSDKLQRIPITNPFAHWMQEQQVAYLDWDSEEPSLTAPLYMLDLQTNDKRLLTEDVINFSSFANFLFVITTNQNGDHLADYTLFRIPEMKVEKTYTAPILSMYSTYLIPYLEFVPLKDSLLIFEPYDGGNVDNYQNKYKLMEISLTNERVLFEDMENLPLRCSPSGNYCLYGFQYEKIINVNKKEVIDIIK